MNTCFADGSSRGNPGPGGWGVIIITGDRVVERGGRDPHTTNNRMELTAAIEAVRHSSSPTTIYTDSQYVIKGITEWVSGWKRNGWKNSHRKPVLNKDLWEALDAAIDRKDITWRHVGGHQGISGNERCDEIATSFADDTPPSLYDGPLSSYPVPQIFSVS